MLKYLYRKIFVFIRFDLTHLTKTSVFKSLQFGKRVLSFICSIFPLAEIDDEINSEVKEIERMKKEISSKELNVFSLKRKKQEYHSQCEEIKKRLKSWKSALPESDPACQSNRQ